MNLPRADENPIEPGAATSMHVGRAISGDAESLNWIVRRLSPLLVAQARYRLGSSWVQRCDPDDIVHDAWLTALPRLEDLCARDGRQTPVLLKFMSTTILNRVRNLLREQARHGGATLPSTEIAAEQSGAVTQALRHEREAAVRAAIQSLDAADREVVLLRGVEQVSTKVAAVVMGTSEEAASKRFRRALTKLRARLPGSVFDEIADE